MSSESDFSANISVVFSQLEAIRQKQDDDRNTTSDSRRRVYERLDDMSKKLHEISFKQASIDQRLALLEDSYASAVPILSEYRMIKQQAVGAGILGKILWRSGAVLLALVAAIYTWRAEISAMLAKVFLK